MRVEWKLSELKENKLVFVEDTYLQSTQPSRNCLWHGLSYWRHCCGMKRTYQLLWEIKASSAASIFCPQVISEFLLYGWFQKLLLTFEIMMKIIQKDQSNLAVFPVGMDTFRKEKLLWDDSVISSDVLIHCGKTWVNFQISSSFVSTCAQIIGKLSEQWQSLFFPILQGGKG